MEDPETGRRAVVDLADPRVRANLEDAAGATLRVEVPNLPDALPRFTVKATVEVTMRDGSKRLTLKPIFTTCRPYAHRMQPVMI